MDASTPTTPAADQDTLAQLREIRNKRAALAEARAARDVLTAAQKLDLEAQALRDEETIERFEAEHGPTKIKAIRSDAGLVIVKRPHRVVFKRFQDKGSIKTDDVEQLVKSCLVHPTKDAFDQMVDDLPALLHQCADACARLAGVRTEETNAK
jgi:hypothetical protein